MEIDKKIAHKNAIIDSYFNTAFKADVIIGNPPYVSFKDIQNKPQSNLLFHKPNLYMFFFEKGIHDLNENGELIFIVPNSILTNTSNKKINEEIYNNFSITYWELITENIWENASVPTAIIKIIKTKNHKDKLNYFFNNGKIIFGEKINWNGKTEVKVGGASGFNSLLENGDVEFVFSETERTNKTKFIKYEPLKWNRSVPKYPLNFSFQIFVNAKTRNNKPFYILKKLQKNEFINYDASVICIYTFGSKEETLELVNKLNNYDWTNAGIKNDGRFHFSQSIIECILN
ncbi:Eco57I restriction-modification methylase domain-containing protein [Metamycoplasma hyosynoviae]|uniref:Eco57I restriction-modification methylase domain-containing protein n=1 Tax=Metamycoplasma hyosynoviae TaxID=29559 RepID=UPI00307AAB8C